MDGTAAVGFATPGFKSWIFGFVVPTVSMLGSDPSASSGYDLANTDKARSESVFCAEIEPSARFVCDKNNCLGRVYVMLCDIISCSIAVCFYVMSCILATCYCDRLLIVLPCIIVVSLNSMAEEGIS